MKSLVIQEIAKPLLRRAGTVLATWLVAQGLAQPMVDQIVLAVTALGAVGLDLVMSSKARGTR